MNIIAKVDVVMADTIIEDTPAEEAPAEEVARRIILLAPTKQQGAEDAVALGIEPVAIVTPRTHEAAYGITADEIVESPALTEEQREELMPHALPSLATTDQAAE